MLAAGSTIPFVLTEDNPIAGWDSSSTTATKKDIFFSGFFDVGVNEGTAGAARSFLLTKRTQTLGLSFSAAEWYPGPAGQLARFSSGLVRGGPWLSRGCQGVRSGSSWLLWAPNTARGHDGLFEEAGLSQGKAVLGTAASLRHWQSPLTLTTGIKEPLG